MSKVKHIKDEFWCFNIICIEVIIGCYVLMKQKSLKLSSYSIILHFIMFRQAIIIKLKAV